VRLQVGKRVFAPHLTGTLATILLLPCLVGLGVWQLDRASEKRALLREFARGEHDTRSVETPREIDSQPRYQRIYLQGHYDPDRQILLDNMPSSRGQPGYHVLTPFVIDAGRSILLVDRGWVPLGATRDELPDIDVSDTARDVTGRLDTLPEPGVRLGTAPEIADGQWPRVFNYPTHDDLVAVYGHGLDERILLLDADDNDGFERIWQGRFGFGPERHLGYAVQWFALAITLLVIYVAVNTKTPADTETVE
jgi:surfeit locus 1 family protein